MSEINIIKNNIYEELQFRSVKMLDISYVVIIYAIIALVFANFTEKIFYLTDEEIEQMSIFELFVRMCAQLAFMSISFYIVRNIVELIPSPFHKIGKFDHSKLTELKNGAIFMNFYVANTSSLKQKTAKLIEKFNKKCANVRN